MRIKELIEELKKYDENMPVYIPDENGELVDINWYDHIKSKHYKLIIGDMGYRY